MILPDKWVRKAFFDRIHNLDVGDKTIKCFDTQATAFHGDNYIILGTQTNVETFDKCGNGWRSTILIEVFTRHKKNTGSRVLADDIIQEILTECEDLNLEPASGLRMNTIKRSTPNDITSETRSEIIHRKFLRYELGIN